jgi:peptidoglycan/LPS O-acetylase OafA/YrhL
MRSDIQVMRGVAVLAVLLCHAFPALFPYGYLGVDLFFVISGFLMTKMIVWDMDHARFTFSGFYMRRARRLLPACISTVAITALVGSAILTVEQWQILTREAVGALTFTANFTAMDAHSLEFYPLRHIWSLSLEEQFYFLYPLLLFWIIPTRNRMAWVAAMAVASFAAWLAVGGTVAFFMLPFRAWELLLGAIIYLAGFTRPTRLRFKPLEAIGDWSYSLYLIHWPLMAFAALYVGWPLPPVVALAACLLSLALAVLQYQYIEQPFRVRRLLAASASPVKVDR